VPFYLGGSTSGEKVMREGMRASATCYLCGRMAKERERES